jgi:DNA-binding NtrC family response regulator
MRTGDVDLLARSFVDTLCREHGLRAKRLTEDTLAVLCAHAWPGNVRELKNTIERAVIVSDTEWIEPRHIILQRRTSVPASAGLPTTEVAGTIEVPLAGMSMAEAEVQLIRITLQITNHNHTRAAKLLGVSRPTLLHRIREYGLEQTD